MSIDVKALAIREANFLWHQMFPGQPEVNGEAAGKLANVLEVLFNKLDQAHRLMTKELDGHPETEKEVDEWSWWYVEYIAGY